MTKTVWFVLLTCVVIGAESSAFAGGCPTCTTSQQCVDQFGAPAFCVLHDQDVGCGPLLQICCPGQACAIDGSGRPTCETAGTCTVVDEPVDAGPIVADADPSAPDAGSGGSTGGCDCRVAGHTRGSLGIASVMLVGLLVLRRRQRQ